MAQQQIPVYLICGFLESGKTNFIAPMLIGQDFTDGERTLLLICEEGEEEYDETALRRRDVVCHTIEEQADLNPTRLTSLNNKYHPTQVVVEYNGMWPLELMDDALPDGWVPYQVVTTVDSATFDSYTKNMGSLMLQKLSSADLIIFNRCTDALADSLRSRNIRMLNRRAEMYLEYSDGRMEEYAAGEPPFDLSAPVLEIEDADFGIWFADVMDNMDRYQNHVVSFRAMVAQSRKFPKNSCGVGRFAMTCCAQDMQFLGVLCTGPEVKKLPNKSWAKITAKVKVEKSPLYQDQPGPVLHLLEADPCPPPAEEVVYF